MALAFCLGGHVVAWASWRPKRRRERVVLSASVGEESRAEASALAAANGDKRSAEWRSSTQRWILAPEATAAGSRNQVVQVLSANRSFKLLRSESRRLGERRLVAFTSAVALTTLAWYGQDLITELGKFTSLPVEDVDGLIYFIVCFNVVSLVLPKSRYSK